MTKRELLSKDGHEMMNEFARLNGEPELSYEERLADMKLMSGQTNRVFIDIVKHGWYINPTITFVKDNSNCT